MFVHGKGKAFLSVCAPVRCKVQKHYQSGFTTSCESTWRMTEGLTSLDRYPFPFYFGAELLELLLFEGKVLVLFNHDWVAPRASLRCDVMEHSHCIPYV